MAQTPELVQQSTEAVSETPPLRPFDSNPFTLSFNALGRLFDTNVGWAIALLILGFIGGGVQFFNLLLSSASSYSDETVTSSPPASDQTSMMTQEQLAGFLIIVAIVLIILTVILFVSFVVQTFITGMLAYVSLQSEKGKKVGLGEAAQAAYQRLWRLVLSQGLASIKIFLWSLLLIIPGIIAALRYSLLVYVIMDEPASNKGVVASHDKVKTIVKGRLFEVLGLVFATAIVPVVSGLLQLTGSAAQYRQLQVTVSTQRPKIHWLNYFLPITIIVLTVLLALLAMIAITMITLGGNG